MTYKQVLTQILTTLIRIDERLVMISSAVQPVSSMCQHERKVDLGSGDFYCHDCTKYFIRGTNGQISERWYDQA